MTSPALPIALALAVAPVAVVLQSKAMAPIGLVALAACVLAAWRAGGRLPGAPVAAARQSSSSRSIRPGTMRLPSTPRRRAASCAAWSAGSRSAPPPRQRSTSPAPPGRR